MSNDFFSGIDQLAPNDGPILKAPFAWPGGKGRSLKKILPLIPYADVYVEVFGGTGIVLLNRKPSPVEVFNDRHSGVTDFYKVLRDDRLLERLCKLVELSLHSKEEFRDCKAEWENEPERVLRAFKWYYHVMCSFGRLGRNWGRAIKPPSSFASQYKDKLSLFPDIHSRLKRVQIDNDDFRKLIRDYDSPTTVFYLDPPYIDSYAGTYKHEMKRHDFDDLKDLIHNTQGFVALSSYHNEYWNTIEWDDLHSWDSRVTIHGDGKKSVKTKGDDARECLYIKEAR